FALYSLPPFWVATMAIVYLGGGDFWNVFPVFGLQSIGSERWGLWDRFVDQVWHLILPITCMTYYTLAALSRYMRSSMLEVVRQFRKNRLSVAGLIIVFGLFLVAILADFIANDKPLLMKYGGSLYSPAVKDYAVWIGLSRWPREFQNISFKDFLQQNSKNGDWVAFPPIPYSPNYVNLA